MEPEKPVRGTPGPKPGPEKKKYTVTLYPSDAEWGMEQEGGLSSLLRRLLREYRQKQEKAET